jgi:hypothetical protein
MVIPEVHGQANTLKAPTLQKTLETPEVTAECLFCNTPIVREIWLACKIKLAKSNSTTF